MSRYIALLAILLVACTQEPVIIGTYEPPRAFDPNQDLNPQPFDSAEDLNAFVQVSGTRGGEIFARGAALMESADATAPAPAMDGKGYSTTNVQVEGIDEGDIVKTDGEYLYIISGTTVFIVTAGEDAEVVSAIEYEDQPSGLFIDGDVLAVFGNFYDNDYFREHNIRPVNGMVFLDLYDVSDRTNPERREEYKFEGSYLQSRMVEGYAYLVVVSYPEARPLPMPIIMRNGALDHVAVHDIYRYPVPYDSLQFATVHAVSLGDGDLTSKTLSIDGAQTVYMSADSIYIAGTEYINEWEIREEVMIELVDLSVEDRQLIAKIEAVDNEVLSPGEKRQKVLQVYYEALQYLPDDARQDLEERIDAETKERLDEYEALEYTIIHKLPFEGGDMRVGQTGKVPGHLNNQFALDEHDGYLRAATTVSQRWWGPFIDTPMPVEPDGGIGSTPVVAQTGGGSAPAVRVGEDMGEALEREEVARIAPEIMPRRWDSTNNVYVLNENLDIVGELTGLAPGEQIYSSRFVADRVYLVTFRQVDPFYVIDLSNPENPEELGQLKLPGFSRYLHPYDENTIIGLGRDATELGRQQGLKISLFDVSDVRNPEELTNWIADDENSQSVAEWEHHAFLFSRERELLVIPAYSYDWRNSREAYNGAMVFRASTDDIELRGIVDHSRGVQHYGPTVQRSLYIGDLLYTLSEGLLRLNRLDTLQGVANVTLSPGARGPYPVY